MDKMAPHPALSAPFPFRGRVSLKQTGRGGSRIDFQCENFGFLNAEIRTDPVAVLIGLNPVLVFHLEGVF